MHSKKLVIALAMTMPAVAMAQSTKELKVELEALKAHVKLLEAMIDKVSAQAALAATAVQKAAPAATLGGGACTDTQGAPANCPDGRNGFGSGMVFDGAGWVVADPSAGSNRGALSLGLHYALMPGVNVKGELRYDRASANVFQNADGQYLRDNQVIGVSTVVSF